MTALSITRVTANTLITAAATNNRASEIEAVVNALTSANYDDDSVGAAALNSDVVRTNYGLVQHTDGSLYVDLSDTNPSLELTDGGLRLKVVDGILNRNAGGVDFGASGDMILSSRTGTPTGWTDVSATYAGKMIRVSATALSTGGSDAHTHGVTITTTQSGGTDYGNGTTPNQGTIGHTHIVSGNTYSGDNVPAYVTSKLFKKD